MDGNADGYKKIENAGKSNNIIEFKDRKIVTSEKLVYLGKTFKITLGKELQIWRITKMKSIPLQENRYLQSTKCIRAPSFPQVFWRQEDRFLVKISKKEFLIHHFAKFKKTIKYQTNG
jgi:hypothetical protein